MSNSSTKQSPGTPSEGLPTLKAMKSRLSKVDRHHLERILKRGSTCLMFEDEAPITVTLKDVKVERKEGLDKAEIYVAIYDVDTGIFIADISSYELLKGAKAAENAGYYEVDCYLGFLNIDKKDCSVNVRWTTGEETFEPLNQVKQDDPVGLADFAKKQGVENNPNFKWVAEVLKEARPKNEEEALRSSKQSEIISKEINNIKTYNTFRQLLFGEPKKRQCVIDVEWNDGNKTTESLSFMKKLDPVGLANWAKENGFLAHSRFSWAVKYLLKDTTKTSDDNKHRSRKKPKHRHMVAPKSDKPLEYLQYRNENDQHQILTRWNPSQEKWESLETLKSIDPTGLALWAKSKSMLNNPEFKWAKTVAELWTWDKNESSQEESSIADDISEEEYMDVYEEVSDDEGISLTRDGQWLTLGTRVFNIAEYTAKDDARRAFHIAKKLIETDSSAEDAVNACRIARQNLEAKKANSLSRGLISNKRSSISPKRKLPQDRGSTKTSKISHEARKLSNPEIKYRYVWI